jgi:hypothetical protein
MRPLSLQHALGPGLFNRVVAALARAASTTIFSEQGGLDFGPNIKKGIFFQSPLMKCLQHWTVQKR